MGRFRYQKEHLDFLREKYPILSLADLTQQFNERFNLNKTAGEIRGTTKNHKIRCGRPTGQMNRGSKLFSSEEISFIKDRYRDLPLPELTVEFHKKFGAEKTQGQLRSYIHNNGITSGRTGRFESGHAPWAKGTKGVVKPNSGNFKKGDVPPNLRPLGSERIDSKDGYVYVKTSAINQHTGFVGWWRQKHLLAWEAEHGPVPKGFIICFLDGDRTNCELENLEMISKAENAIRNKQSFSSLPEELKPTMRLVAKVQSKRFELLKKANEGR